MHGSPRSLLPGPPASSPFLSTSLQASSGAARGAAAEAALPELLAELRAVAESGEVSEEFAKEFPGELEEVLGGLRAARAEAEAGLTSLRDQHLRLTADYDNFRRRSAAEREAEAGRARAGAVRELLGVVDSFEQAAAAMQPASDAERAVVSAYDAVYRQLAAAFRKLGVEAVPGEGAAFDPEVHEAIMREPAPEGVPDGTVLQEFRKGFRLGQQLLRAGMVKVAYTEDGA